MTNTEDIPLYILVDVAQNMGYEGIDFMNDPKMVNRVNRLTEDEVFSKWCNWQGLVGWAGTLKQAMTDIYGIED